MDSSLSFLGKEIKTLGVSGTIVSAVKFSLSFPSVRNGQIGIERVFPCFLDGIAGLRVVTSKLNFSFSLPPSMYG